MTRDGAALVSPLPDEAPASFRHLPGWPHGAGARTQQRGDADAFPGGGVVLELRARKRRREGAASS